jgi:signal transduction histidine kinase
MKKLSLQGRVFASLVVLLVLFIMGQFGLYTWVEYRNWIEHPVVPFRDAVEEVESALVLNLVLLPLILFLAWRLSHRILGPVRAIANTAERIGGGQFDDRIDTSAMADDEMHKLANAINTAFDRYDSAVQRLQRFAGDASHQLRTPLAAIRTMGEVAVSRDRSAAEYREAISGMLQDMDRLRAVIEQLLTLSRLEQGALRGRFKHLDVDEAMTEVARLYGPVCEEHRISLERSSTPGLRVNGALELLTEMVGNLVDNAIRHTPNGGAIRLGCLRRGEAAVLFVHDNGPGIAEDLAERIFERFFQIPGGSVGGAGLGLALARDIAMLHGGTLRLVNPGQAGARFEASLPVTQVLP